jgi:SAM-dependent methyltransferase
MRRTGFCLGVSNEIVGLASQSTTQRLILMDSPPLMTNAPPELYSNYYATSRELEWYEATSLDKGRNILDLCLPLSPIKVLDIGAGNGSVLQRYVDGGLGKEVHAIEISESGLIELRKRLDSRFVSALSFDGIRIPYPDNSFDLAILSHVLEHVEHPRLLLHEIRRVAKHLYVEVPLECRSLRSSLRGDWEMDTTGHINYYNKDLIRRELQTSGWAVNRIEIRRPTSVGLTFMQGRLGWVQWAIKSSIMAVAPRIAEGLFCWNCAVLCTSQELPPVTLGLVDAHLRR